MPRFTIHNLSLLRHSALLVLLGVWLLVGCAADADIDATPTADPDVPVAIATVDAIQQEASDMSAAVSVVRMDVVAEYAPDGAIVDTDAPFGDHDATLEIPFGEIPPRGGVHHPLWQTCGLYFDPVYPKHALHSMEHGAVWVTYQPDMHPRDRAVLENEIGIDPWVIISPYPGLRSPVVLTAWGVQLEVDDVNDARIAQFLDEFKSGIQAPEPFASCAGGTAITMSSQ